MEWFLRRGKASTEIAAAAAAAVNLQQRRRFLRARIRWVKDCNLDEVVQREKNLKPLLFIKDSILCSPRRALPISAITVATSALNLPSSAASFILRYPSVFRAASHRTVSLTDAALALHDKETSVHASLPNMVCTADRLARLLMLAGSGAGSLPFAVLDTLQYDMGLPHNYALTLLSHFPDYFTVAGSGGTLSLQLVRKREELAVSWMQGEGMTGFPMKLPKGFDLKKEVVKWVEGWQRLPYMSPYEKGFHLSGRGDQWEKWVVGILHELVHLCVGKKMEKGVVLGLGEQLGFGRRMFEKVFAHYPGIFYLCNKIRTQTVVLRECYVDEALLENHPLVEIRHRYVDLMNESSKKMVQVM